MTGAPAPALAPATAGDAIRAAGVMGSPGVALDLTTHLLREAGVPLATADDLRRRPDRCVMVLVEPSAQDWDTALASRAPILVVCGDRVDPHGAVEAVMLGAEAVVHAGCSPARLLEACEVVALGGSSFDPDQARALATAARSRAQLGPGRLRLTGREVDILTSIQRGDAMKQTARTLGISIKTVENLQGRLYRKLGVRNRAHAMARAHSMGFVGTPQHTASP